MMNTTDSGWPKGHDSWPTTKQPIEVEDRQVLSENDFKSFVATVMSPIAMAEACKATLAEYEAGTYVEFSIPDMFNWRADQVGDRTNWQLRSSRREALNQQEMLIIDSFGEDDEQPILEVVSQPITGRVRQVSLIHHHFFNKPPEDWQMRLLTFGGLNSVADDYQIEAKIESYPKDPRASEQQLTRTSIRITPQESSS